MNRLSGSHSTAPASADAVLIASLPALRREDRSAQVSPGQPTLSSTVAELSKAPGFPGISRRFPGVFQPPFIGGRRTMVGQKPLSNTIFHAPSRLPRRTCRGGGGNRGFAARDPASPVPGAPARPRPAPVARAAGLPSAGLPPAHARRASRAGYLRVLT